MMPGSARLGASMAAMVAATSSVRSGPHSAVNSPMIIACLLVSVGGDDTPAGSPAGSLVVAGLECVCDFCQWVAVAFFV